MRSIEEVITRIVTGSYELSPRSAKKDLTVTKNLHEAGILEDERSFISLDGHLFLEGPDKAKVRNAVFKKHKSRCVICRHQLSHVAADFDPMRGAWHHVKNCDCVGCSELRCDTTTGRKCHAHRTEGFQREAAKEDFNKPYPEAGDEHSGDR